jgi:hypothetical protein
MDAGYLCFRFQENRMKLHSFLTLFTLVAAAPAAACPGPSARNDGPYRNVTPNTSYAVMRNSYSNTYDLEAYDCARVTDWYSRYGWWYLAYPARRSIVGHGWHFGRGR